jgi:hypothetical protein
MQSIGKKPSEHLLLAVYHLLLKIRDAYKIIYNTQKLELLRINKKFLLGVQGGSFFKKRALAVKPEESQ